MEADEPVTPVDSPNVSPVRKAGKPHMLRPLPQTAEQIRKAAVLDSINDRRFQAGLPPLMDPTNQRPTLALPRGAASRPATADLDTAVPPQDERQLMNQTMPLAGALEPELEPEPEPEPHESSDYGTLDMSGAHKKSPPPPPQPDGKADLALLRNAVKAVSAVSQVDSASTFLTWSDRPGPACAFALPEPEPEPEPQKPERTPHWLWKFRTFPEASPMSLSDVPEDLLLRVLSCLPGHALGRLCRVNSSLRTLLGGHEGQELWRTLQRRGDRLPLSPAHLGRLVAGDGGAKRVPDWRDAFIASLRIDDNWKAGRLERHVRHGHHGLVSAVALAGELTLTASNDSTLRVFAGDDTPRDNMIRGGENGCVAIDTRTDHQVRRGAKSASINCMRVLGNAGPGSGSLATSHTSTQPADQPSHARGLCMQRVEAFEAGVPQPTGCFSAGTSGPAARLW